ncbi:hypothetical protein GNI_189780 [Gregarina niphandrodes]|uniref:Uncharacterized protein n=1 Tax=Gregarina niphandrodes TaxID=110365 RepID=A0A023AWG0_GRENI|nr:hypothetical protein GNI_189780 [Gregarina niphandrodes]EZG43081.1 hypothetical protein GNI_189780 [Gregarina niphandrodes]|eukprot:XP_011133647.1 hypothetical protein GNI_189780 [Gregarina niphandrodes]
MVEAYTGMTTLTKENHVKLTKQVTDMVNELAKKLQEPTTHYSTTRQAPRPLTTSQTRKSSTSHSPDTTSEATTTRRGRSTTKQTTRPLNSRTPLPWNKVAGTTAIPTRVGRRKDQVVINDHPALPEQTTPTEITLDSNDRKALWEPKPPQTVEVTAVTLDRVKPRQMYPAKEWRVLLKKHDVHPVAIWFPWRTSVEILVRTEELPKLKALTAAMNREAQILDPTKRKDGQPGPLSQAAITTAVNIRLKDLQYERHWTARHYLEQIVRNLIALLPDDLNKTMLYHKLNTATAPPTANDDTTDNPFLPS